MTSRIPRPESGIRQVVIRFFRGHYPFWRDARSGLNGLPRAAQVRKD